MAGGRVGLARGFPLKRVKVWDRLLNAKTQTAARSLGRKYYLRYPFW